MSCDIWSEGVKLQQYNAPKLKAFSCTDVNDRAGVKAAGADILFYAFLKLWQEVCSPANLNLLVLFYAHCFPASPFVSANSSDGFLFLLAVSPVSVVFSFSVSALFPPHPVLASPTLRTTFIPQQRAFMKVLAHDTQIQTFCCCRLLRLMRLLRHPDEIGGS